MPYFPSAQLFLEQSRLLIAARPTTTKISTKYTLSEPSKQRSAKNATNPAETSSKDAQPQPPGATLTLRTYDPVSGTCLKYSTDKAAEVGRLVAALSDCGRIMAAMPDKEAAMDIDEAVKKEEPETKALDSISKVPPHDSGKGKDTKATQGKSGEKGAGGGGGKKKKGGKK